MLTYVDGGGGGRRQGKTSPTLEKRISRTKKALRMSAYVSIRQRIKDPISLSSELFNQDERSMAYVSIRQQACYATRVTLVL